MYLETPDVVKWQNSFYYLLSRAFQSFTETLGLPSEDSESSFVNKSLSDQITKLPTEEGRVGQGNFRNLSKIERLIKIDYDGDLFLLLTLLGPIPD